MTELRSSNYKLGIVTDFLRGLTTRFVLLAGRTCLAERSSKSSASLFSEVICVAIMYTSRLLTVPETCSVEPFVKEGFQLAKISNATLPGGRVRQKARQLNSEDDVIRVGQELILYCRSNKTAHRKRKGQKVAHAPGEWTGATKYVHTRCLSDEMWSVEAGEAREILQCG